MSVKMTLDITVTDFIVRGKEKNLAGMIKNKSNRFSIQGPKSISAALEEVTGTVDGRYHCSSSPGFMSVRVNTNDPTLSVLFISTGTFRLSSVSQMKTTPLFMNTPSCLG